MTRKRKSKKKRKRKAQKKTKEKSKLDQLKEKQSQLFTRVEENKKIILNQTGISNEEFNEVVNDYGYDALSSIEGFDIAGPIWDQMLELFKVYDQVAKQVERLKVLESRMLIHESKKLTEEMEIQLQELDKEDSYYTEKPNQEGIVKMKPKWYAEKEYWEKRKKKFKEFLEKEPENKGVERELKEAEDQLKVLNKKRNWARTKNIMPSITKYSQKFGKGVDEVRTSIRDATKPFAEMSEMSGFSEKKSKNQKSYEDMFSSGSDANIGKQFENMFYDDSKSKSKKKKGPSTDWRDYFGEVSI